MIFISPNLFKNVHNDREILPPPLPRPGAPPRDSNRTSPRADPHDHRAANRADRIPPARPWPGLTTHSMRAVTGDAVTRSADVQKPYVDLRIAGGEGGSSQAWRGAHQVQRRLHRPLQRRHRHLVGLGRCASRHQHPGVPRPRRGFSVHRRSPPEAAPRTSGHARTPGLRPRAGHAPVLQRPRAADPPRTADQRSERGRRRCHPLTLSPFLPGRYLDYCSELLSLTGKVAVLYARNVQDSVVLDAVNEIESLTNGFARKIWQKIMPLESVVANREAHP